MSNYAIMRVAKIKSFDGAKAVENHNTREVEVKHAIKEYTHLNQNIIGTDDIKADIQRILDQKGITKIRKNGVLALEYILTASPGYFGCDQEGYTPDPNDPKLQLWLDGCKDFIFEEFGDSVAQIHLHMDEKTPHLHCVCVPVVRNHIKATERRSNRKYEAYKLSANNWTDGIEKLREKQDLYWTKLAERGTGLERGIKASKNSVDLYKERASRDLEALKIAHQETIQKLEDSINNHRELNYQAKKDLRKEVHEFDELMKRKSNAIQAADRLIFSKRKELKELKEASFQTSKEMEKKLEEFKNAEKAIYEADRKLKKMRGPKL
jgi:hypothetical protein